MLSEKYLSIIRYQLSNAGVEEEEFWRTFHDLRPLLQEIYTDEHMASMAADICILSSKPIEQLKAKQLLELVKIKEPNMILLEIKKLEPLNDNRYKLYAVDEEGKLYTRVFDDSVSTKWAQDRKEFLASIAQNEEELVAFLQSIPTNDKLIGRKFLGKVKAINVNGFDKLVIEKFRRC